MCRLDNVESGTRDAEQLMVSQSVYFHFEVFDGWRLG